MKPIKWILLIAFAGLILPQLAASDTISQTAIIDWKSAGWTETACIDKFDPSLGTLKKVTIEMETCDFVKCTVENEQSSRECFIVDILCQSLTTLPNGDVVGIDLPHTEEFCIEPDGSYSFEVKDCKPSDIIDYTDPVHLSEFIGSDKACFAIKTSSSVELNGGSAASFYAFALMMHMITVTYDYQPPLSIRGQEIDKSNDEGLAGWTINLKENGAVIRTATTDSSGFYEFSGLVPGSYTVCEEVKPGWTKVGPTCIPVELIDGDVEDIDFRVEPSKIPCGGGCPWFIKNELYRAQCGVLKEVPADSGILANDPDGTTVINPESITINPKLGNIQVEEDGSFIFDPSPDIKSGTYVIFKYGANNGICDAKYMGLAKIQVSCKRS